MKYTAAHWGAYEIHDNALKPVADDPEPSRIGKGWLSASRNLDSRILRPAIRKGWLEGDVGANRCDDVFVEVGWDEAASRVAEELTRISRAYGNGAIYGGSYGWGERRALPPCAKPAQAVSQSGRWFRAGAANLFPCRWAK